MTREAAPPMPDDVESALAMFAATAARTPEAAAIYYFDGVVSYGELDRLSNAFAVALLEGGFAAGDRVGLYMQNMPAFLIALLGAWKAGGIAVTINGANRVHEMTLLLNDFEPHALVLTPELHRDVVQHLPPGVFRPQMLFGASPFDFQTRNDERVLPSSLPARNEGLADFLETLKRHAGARPPAQNLGPDDLAFIVYTSGTTGVPKGARLLHRNVLAGVKTNLGSFGLAPGDRILGMAPLFHITGLMSQISTGFGIGASLVLSYRFDPAVMVAAVREHRATHVFGAATAYIAMLNTPGASPDDMASIRIAGSGGAPTPPPLVERAEAFLGAKVQIGYGLTETAIATHSTPHGTVIPVDPASGALSIGRPNPGFSSWIEADDGKPAAAGEAGELLITGPSIADGYWRKPEQTAEAFTPDGFRTGDIAICDAAGWYYIVDRKKDMISASGFKVWPREVEDMLYAHPAVREAAVVGVPDAYRGETVLAFVSLRPQMSATPEALLAHCRKNLAAYKCPREVRIIEDLPKTASGKILRREMRGK